MEQRVRGSFEGAIRREGQGGMVFKTERQVLSQGPSADFI